MATLSNTLALARQGFLEYLGEFHSSTTSAAGNVGGTTFPDSTNLVDKADDYFNLWWALITASTTSTIVGEVRRISDFTQSTGTVTVIAAYAAQVPISSTYELLMYHPTTMIRWALNKALQEVYKSLPKSILNEDLITGNALPNSNFRTWTVSTTPDHWVATTITAAKETSVVKYGTASAKLTASAGYIGCEAMTGAATIWLPLLDLAGKTIDFEAWAKTATASHIRLAIVDDDGTTYSTASHSATSGYNTGGNTWELMKATRQIKAATKTIAFRVYGDVGSTTAYIDNARAIGGDVSEIPLPTEIITNDIEKVYIQNLSGELTSPERPCDDLGWVNQPTEWTDWKVRYDNRLGLWLLSFTEKPLPGYKIRIQAKEYAAKLSSDTDTVPFDEVQLNLLYPYAAYRMFKALGDTPKANDHLAEYERLRPSLAMTREVPVQNFSREKWR